MIKKLTPAGALLVFVNIGFIVAGAVLIHFASTLKSSGWTDALKDTDYETTANTATTAVEVLGYGAIVLAVLGIVGAVLQNRLLLLIYAVVMLAAMVAFGVIGGTSYAFKNKLEDWEDKDFPGDSDETDLAETFNEIYCYAQGAYLCNNASSQDALQLFYPNTSSAVISLLPDVEGINSLCDEYENVVTEMASICEACAQAAKFSQYGKILSWANEQCPATTETATWCASFLATGTAGEVYVDSPYRECRTVFLDIAIDWSSDLTVMGLVAAVVSALIVGLSCCSRRGKYAESSSGKPY